MITRSRLLLVVTCVGSVLGAAHAVSAQTAAPVDGRVEATAPVADAQPARRVGDLDPGRATMLRNRYHMRQMESVLVRAVEHAAEVMSHRLTTVSPDVMALAGVPRAQGFRIEGHGLFFSVEVPRLSDSMNWALQVLSANRDERTLVTLRQIAEAESDPVRRADVERAIRALERQMVRRTAVVERPAAARRAAAETMVPVSASAAPGGGAASERSVSEGVAASSLPDDDASGAPAPPSPPEPDLSLLANPSAAYEEEVKTALADALIDYALTLPLAPGDTVTVAARDAGYIAFPDAVTEMVTVTLSVSVDDLLAFRQQRIDRDEVRRRVLVREF